jgi:hypothetical protein
MTATAEILLMIPPALTLAGLCQLRYPEGRIACLAGAGTMCLTSPFWIHMVIG